MYRNSLFGVDIDSGAAEIAKLRLWLSLVVDEEDILSIKTLPNLDYKIVCGNSLLGLPEGVLLNTETIKKIENFKDKFINTTNPKLKNDLKEKIDELIYELIKEASDLIKYNLDIKFDFHIFFPEVFHNQNAFDIVIANPPYIGEKGDKEIFREIKQSPLKKYYSRKMDVFYFFFHLAINICKENSIIAFITTNYYPTAFGARKLREDFKWRSSINHIINFNELKIFDLL